MNLVQINKQIKAELAKKKIKVRVRKYAKDRSSVELINPSNDQYYAAKSIVDTYKQQHPFKISLDYSFELVFNKSGLR